MNIVDRSVHSQVWELIPWVVNGRADAASRCAVDAHVAECADCRDELELQVRIRSAMDPSEDPSNAAIAARPALRQFWARVDGAGPSLAVPPKRPRWLRLAAAALVIETIAVSGLATALWLKAPPTADYRTLSSSAPAARGASTIRAVFAPTLSQEATQALLRASGLRIVDGPSEAGVYSLAPVPAADAPPPARALALLRAQAGVRFAEPVGDGAAP